MQRSGGLPVIKVVGVSASGKSSLVRGLRLAGYDARPVSQEHSNVPDLWRQFEPPHFLIYLTVSLASQQQRRPDVTWTEAERLLEESRLSIAREHANVRIDTTHLAERDVLRLVISYLCRRSVGHSVTALPPVPATGSASQRAG